ncbi:TerB family tellurite resistance protein [Hymenobacter weizhouensis]|uniref:TerB family tellurite resistance protein n=1 Tax=Hymenobacter sp. YIM 151500-1 TaxID=2987689 RepID=UPI002225E6E8|nr:TerB family tellurite resistance protein [Hymenobacter sp. YIM 151500-1]UYZ65137.1 TerB family tellurite resistance protein [Hymenobacter sp. YIM 151500-1]
MQTTHTLDQLLDTQHKKLAFFQNLILVAAADGAIDTSESQFLLELGQRLGLSAEDVQPIAENLDVLSFIVPADGLQRTLELQTLVQMMLQDGQIDPREYGLCLEYAHRIGYGKAILDDMVSQLAGGPPVPNRNPPTVS